jgi:hypothetical protein
MTAIAAVKTSSILGPTEITTSATVSVDKTFDPEGFILPGVARWCDRSGGIAIGYPRFSLSVRPPTKVARVYKVTAKLVLPTLEQTSASTSTGIQPAPTKAYDCTCLMEFLLPERSTLAERNALLSHVRSLFITTITASDAAPSDSTGSPLIAAVASFEPPY